MSGTRKYVILVAMCFSACTSDNEAPGTPGATGEPVTSSVDMVPVPGTRRLFHKDCIHEVPDGALIRQVGSDTQVWSDDKLVATYQKCTVPAVAGPAASGCVENTNENA